MVTLSQYDYRQLHAGYNPIPPDSKWKAVYVAAAILGGVIFVLAILEQLC